MNASIDVGRRGEGPCAAQRYTRGGSLEVLAHAAASQESNKRARRARDSSPDPSTCDAQGGSAIPVVQIDGMPVWVAHDTYAALQRHQREQRRACETIGSHFLRWRTRIVLARLTTVWRRVHAQVTAMRVALASARSLLDGELNRRALGPGNCLVTEQNHCAAMTEGLLGATATLRRKVMIAALGEIRQLARRKVALLFAPPPTGEPVPPIRAEAARGGCMRRTAGATATHFAPGAAGATSTGDAHGAVRAAPTDGLRAAADLASVALSQPYTWAVVDTSPASQVPAGPSFIDPALLIHHLARARATNRLTADEIRRVVKKLLRQTYPELWQGHPPGAPGRGEIRTVTYRETWRNFVHAVPADSLDDALRAMGRQHITLHERTFTRGRA